MGEVRWQTTQPDTMEGYKYQKRSKKISTRKNRGGHVLPSLPVSNMMLHEHLYQTSLRESGNTLASFIRVNSGVSRRFLIIGNLFAWLCVAAYLHPSSLLLCLRGRELGLHLPVP